VTIPTDRLRELANGATIYGHERNEIAAELLACREERESQRFILSGLRALLVRCGRAVGVKMADEVSTDFLGYVPAEVERVVARLHEERDAARAEAEQARRDGQEQTAGLHEKLAEVRAELAAVKRQRDELVKACSAKDDLLACYRLGKRPSEALFKRLDKAKRVLDALAAEQPKPHQPEGGAP